MNRQFIVFFTYKENDVVEHANISFGYNKFPPQTRIKELISCVSKDSATKIVITNILELNEEDYLSFVGAKKIFYLTDDTKIKESIDKIKDKE